MEEKITEENINMENKFAGFGSRFVAWLLDSILMGILAGIFGCCAAGIIVFAASSESDLVTVLSVASALVIFIIVLFFQFVYFGYLWSRDGQSLGMKLVNIKVVHRGGSLVSFWRGGFRGSLGYWISSLVFYLGFIWAAIDEDNETWHDKLFDTWVVNS
jgi:uncharacterized RDD family membrane protein YckC